MSKRLIKLFLAVGIVGGLAYFYYHSKPVVEEKGVRPLHVEDGKIKDNENNIVVLRGMSTHGLGWYPRFINANALQSLKERGANIIRLAMYSDANDGYLEEPYNLDFMYIGIENAIAEDMYVIVDWHILKDNNPLDHMEEAIQFFKEIASQYGDRPNLIYEICNEPNGDTTWEDISKYANEIIPVIRESAPEALIIVGTPKYSTGLKYSMEKPLDYDNLLYAYHIYVDVSVEDKPDYYWLEKAVENNFPVFVSEWGIAYGMDSFQQQLTDEELEWQKNALLLAPAHHFLNYMEENDISWCGWALSNSHEIHAAIKENCNKVSDWKDEDLTPGGKLMFDYFKDREDR